MDEDGGAQSDRTLSAVALAHEAGTTVERIGELTRIGVLQSTSADGFEPGDIMRVRTAQAFLDAGITSEQLERAIRERLITFEFVDRFYLQPPPRSERTYADLRAVLGDRAAILDRVFAALELPEPDPSAHLSLEEEAVLEEFVTGWAPAGDDETYIRAARLIAGASRQLNEGWLRLFVEKMSLPEGDDESPDEAIERTLEPGTRLAMLGPRMFVWLQQRHLEQAQTAMAVEGIEARLAGLRLAPSRRRTHPAVAFVDLTGYTRMTEHEGDAAAVRFASTLHELAESATRAHGGRLVKLLGDGAMLHFPDPSQGVEGILGLVRSLGEARLTAHAGIHCGPVIERDRDLFGRTVNVAARVTGAGGPGHVIATEAVVAAGTDLDVTFAPLGERAFKGIAEPIALFHVRSREYGRPE